MNTLQISLFSMLFAQFLKIFTKFPPDFTKAIGSGGFPSSHASFVSTLSTTIGLKYGFNSDLFAITAVFSLIIIYDAGGVRRAVGEQANVLNNIINHLNPGNFGEEKQFIKEELKELIGHTPVEVLSGIVLGSLIAIINILIN